MSKNIQEGVYGEQSECSLEFRNVQGGVVRQGFGLDRCV